MLVVQLSSLADPNRRFYTLDKPAVSHRHHTVSTHDRTDNICYQGWGLCARYRLISFGCFHS